MFIAVPQRATENSQRFSNGSVLTINIQILLLIHHIISPQNQAIQHSAK